jgi:adenylate cyclase
MTATAHPLSGMRTDDRSDRAGALDGRSAAVFMKEERLRERVAFKARLIALIIIALWLTAMMPFRATVYYYGLLCLFALIGYGHLRLTESRPHAVWLRYGLIAADFALLAFTTLGINPLAHWYLPAPARLENGNFGYFLIILVGIGHGYSTWRTIVAGICAAAAWACGYAWIAMQPGTFTVLDTPIATHEEWLRANADPMFVDLQVLVQDLIILGIITGMLALAVRGSRRLVLEQIQLTRERENLARYFPPTLVESLAGRNDPLGPVRSQPVGVLFADMIGFTRWAEQRPPNQVIGLLREVHQRLGAAVFRYSGTLDKFMGDGLMATFGTPDAGDRDAANAIAAACAMREAIEEWNATQPNEHPVRLAIGVNYGPVVLGDIGSAHRLEFAVLGDTVNVASRLERATREIGCSILVSEAAVAAARPQDPETVASALKYASYHPEIAMQGHLPVPAYALD